MIRNIVFDMGMVLLDYHPLTACREAAENEADAQQICHVMFESPEWIRLDDGSLTKEALTEQAQAQLPERLRPVLQGIMHGMPRNVLSPIPGMADVVDGVLNNGYHVYLLSNACLDVSQNRDIIPHIERFHGVVFSVEESMIKPNPEIYRRLTARYGLVPAECLFVDDNQNNVAGARAEGWQAYWFDGDVQKFAAYLAQLER